jgi:hypothetical protein
VRSVAAVLLQHVSFDERLLFTPVDEPFRGGHLAADAVRAAVARNCEVSVNGREAVAERLRFAPGRVAQLCVCRSLAEPELGHECRERHPRFRGRT